MTILYIFIAILVSAALTYLLLNGKIALLQNQLAQAEANQQKITQLEVDNKAMFGKLSQLEGQNETLKQTVDSQKADEEKLRKILVDVSNDSVLRQGKMLSDQQQVKLNDVLNPLKEKLKEFEEKVNLGQKNSLEQSTILMEQIKNLTSLNQTVTQKTEDLTNALGMILQQGITMAKKKKPEKYKNIPDILPRLCHSVRFHTRFAMEEGRSGG
jgi:DNA recombination protein RmuC